MQRLLLATGGRAWRPASSSLAALGRLAGAARGSDFAQQQASLSRRASSAAAAVAPKKPSTSWMLFLADYRRDHPEVTGKDILPAASALWQALSDEQKAPWVEQSETEKATYEKLSVAAAAKAQRQRDPERPKLPATSYIRFLRDFGKQRLAEKGATQIKKLPGEEWKRLTEREKQPYVDAYAADKRAYDVALEQYKQSGKAAAWKERVSPTTRDPERPKLPKTPYFRFLEDFRKRHPDVKMVTELTKKAGAEWKALSEREKQPYVDAYAADKVAYEAAMGRYAQSGKAAAWKDRVSPPTRDPERPKVPTTAYFRFLEDFRKRHPDVKKVTELSQKAGAEWKLLSEREKQPYLDAYAADKAAYQLAMREYVASGKEDAWKADHAQALAEQRAKLRLARQQIVARARQAVAAAAAAAKA